MRNSHNNVCESLITQTLYHMFQNSFPFYLIIDFGISLATEEIRVTLSPAIITVIISLHQLLQILN